MGEIIKVDDSSYGKYVELLSKRDSIKKKAFQYHQAYICEFGDMILEVFQTKIECIRKKKNIEYCQRALNHGGIVDRSELDAYLIREMNEYQKQLEEMIDQNEKSKGLGTVSEIDLLKIKSIYRKLAKLIHPDINPDVNDSEELTGYHSQINGSEE